MRFDVSLKVTVEEILSLEDPGPAAAISSEIRNLSSTGMCLLVDRTCTVSSVVRCQVFFPGSPASIPTLARIRWIEDHPHEKSLAGVEFLL